MPKELTPLQVVQRTARCVRRSGQKSSWLRDADKSFKTLPQLQGNIGKMQEIVGKMIAVVAYWPARVNPFNTADLLFGLEQLEEMLSARA